MVNLKRGIPRSLDDCRDVDYTANAIREWGGRIENVGGVVLCILIMIGIISTIMTAGEIADIDEDLVFVEVVMSLLTWGLYSVIEYTIYRFIATLLYALASIVQSVCITSNVALYTNKAIVNDSEESTELDNSVEKV